MAVPAEAAPLTGDLKYEETESLLQEVVALYSDKADVALVRECGKTVENVHATQEARHQEVLESIRELTGQLQRARQEHADRKSSLLDETQKHQLLTERSRVDENIRRLALVGAPPPAPPARAAHVAARPRAAASYLTRGARAGDRRAEAEHHCVRHPGSGALCTGAGAPPAGERRSASGAAHDLVVREHLLNPLGLLISNHQGMGHLPLGLGDEGLRDGRQPPPHGLCTCCADRRRPPTQLLLPHRWRRSRALCRPRRRL
jgi:hypothetical protein